MIVAFLGPSLAAAEARGCTVLPPARQGDLWRALRMKPRAIALIDGVFESQPSVWHHEILDALDAGVLVFGGASMGALRAAELHTRGMIGVGQVFRWYRDAVIADDAEVALLHASSEHGFVPLTVPQVNVRFAAQEAVRQGVLRRTEARALVAHAAEIFYQERSWPAVLRVLPRAALEKWRRWKAPDLKATDAREVLRAAAASRALRQPAARDPPPSSLVRRRRWADPALWKRPDAAELSDRGLRRALLAGWARELGLRPPRAEVDSVRAALPLHLDADEAVRIAEDLVLERLVLDHAPRLLNDGPSADEALAREVALLAAGKRR